MLQQICKFARMVKNIATLPVVPNAKQSYDYFLPLNKLQKGFLVFLLVPVYVTLITGIFADAVEKVVVLFFIP